MAGDAKNVIEHTINLNTGELGISWSHKRDDVQEMICVQNLHRYILTLSGADHTGQLWLQGFNDVGNVLFGMTANELKGLEVRFR